LTATAVAVLYYVGLLHCCFTVEDQNPSVSFLYTGGGARLDSALVAKKKLASTSSSGSDAEVR